MSCRASRAVVIITLPARRGDERRDTAGEEEELLSVAGVRQKINLSLERANETVRWGSPWVHAWFDDITRVPEC